jgi:hypothetical protein
MLNFRKLFAREVRNHKYEWDDQSQIYLTQSKVTIGGVFTYEHFRQGDLMGVGRNHNRVVQQGRAHLLQVLLAGATQIDPWYLGLFKGNYTPVDGDTAANIVANANEAQAEYDEAQRPAFVEVVSGSVGTNDASKAVFTFNANVTIYGGFLISVNTKGSTSGTLFSAGRFDNGSRDMQNTDQLQVRYDLEASDAS